MATILLAVLEWESVPILGLTGAVMFCHEHVRGIHGVCLHMTANAPKNLIQCSTERQAYSLGNRAAGR